MQNVYWMIGFSVILGLSSKALNQRFLKLRDLSKYKIRQRVLEKAYQIEYEEWKSRNDRRNSQGGSRQ